MTLFVILCHFVITYFTDTRNCNVARACYEFKPSHGIWSNQTSELIDIKWAHYMGLIDFDSTRRVPIALGYGDETNIYNPDTEAWEEYNDLEDPSWTSMYCLIQVGDSVWHIRNGIYELELNSWQYTDYGSVPSELTNAGSCSYQEIDEQPGMHL